MESFLFVYICVITSFKVSFVLSQDPCLEANHQTLNEDKRSPGHKFEPSSDLAISDDRLTLGWYRIMSEAGETMPSSAPDTFKCGTWYPIWLNGAPPVTTGETKTVPVCLQTFDSTCENTWDIQIKICSGGFLVYELSSSPIIDSAYCFGSSGPCPNGTSSETGYTPGCSSDFPPDEFTPEVTVARREGDVLISAFNVYNIEPVFICSFPDPGQTFYYDIHWYINENKVKTEENILFAELEQTILRPRHWEAAYDMNMLVKCSVRARTSENSVPGYHFYSADFVAGIVPDAFVYEVDEGQTVNVTLRATVPIGCNAQMFINNCKETIKLSYPNEYSCRRGDTKWGPIIQENCGADVLAKTWYENHTLIVHGNIDNMYNIKSVRYASVKLTKASSKTDPSDAWEKVNIPDIIIKINDQDPSLSGKTCLSYTDPNYNTFDGKRYSAQISGEYVLYRHKREPYWVHTLSSGCFWGTCNVGIAIRSHDSLFVVRTVDECRNPIQFNGTDHDYTATITSRTYPMIDFRVCDDRNMKIQRNGKEFTVTLPSGTEIFFRIKLDIWNDDLLVVNNINIKPSLLDISQTEGLCGTLNFNSNDEFQERNTETIVSQDQFVTSWSISNSSDESLFATSPKFTNDRFFYKPYCVCGEEETGRDPIGDKYHVHCNLTQPMEQCYENTTNIDTFLYSSCSGRKRRDTRYIRDTQESDEVFDISPLTYSPDFQEKYIPLPADWKFEWTEDLARETCIHAFDNVTALETCKEYANLNTDDYIASCMTDIKETGGTSLLQGTILTMFSVCLSEVSRNETLFVTPSNNSTNGTSGSTGTSGVVFKSMLDEIKSQLCNNNCSQNGICDKGNCVCDDRFIGDDCSYLRTSPPVGLTIPYGGKCGTRSRNCERTLLNGRFESTEVWCKLVYFEVVNNKKQSSLNPIIEKAEYKSFSTVSCPLPTSSERRRKRSISYKTADGYDISLSNDGTIFGDEATILIYDDECYSCNVTSVSCTLLSSCSLTTVETSGVSSDSVVTTDSTVKTSTANKPTNLLTTTTTPQRHSSTSETTTTTPQRHSSTSETTTTTPQRHSFTSESTTKTVQPTEDSHDMILIICGTVVGICLLVAIGFIVYCKCKPSNATQTNLFPDFDGKNVAPYITHMQSKGEFRKENSYLANLDMQWLDNRPKTPEHLFVASDCKS